MSDDQPPPLPQPNEPPAPVQEPPRLPQPAEPPLPTPEPMPLPERAESPLPGPESLLLTGPAEPSLSGPPPQPPPAPERDPCWGYSDLLLFMGLAIPSLLLGIGFVKGASFLLRIHAPNRAAELLTGQFAGYAVLFGALRLILRVQYGRPFWRSLGWIGPGLPYIWIVLPGLGTAITVAMLAYVIGTPTTTNPMMELLKDRISVILVAAFGVTMGPLCEELAFRGFLQPLLVRSLGALPGIIAAAIPFGLLHFQEYGNSWKHALVISLAGAAFGAMRHATGSTKASTIMHASYNALFFAGLLAQGKNVPQG